MSRTANAVMERPFPQNAEAERAILGGVLLDNLQLDAAVREVRPADFFQVGHRTIFEQMTEIAAAGGGIDLITITEKLERAGKLEIVGGAAYLASLIDGVARISHVEHYARIVRERAMLRGIVHVGAQLQEEGFNGESDAEEALDRAEAALFALAERGRHDGLRQAQAVVDEHGPHLLALREGGERLSGLATGYHELDVMTSGLQPSELIVLAARPSVGKTSFALNVISNVTLREEGTRLPVALFSIEMNREAILTRLVAERAHISAHRLRGGRLSREHRERIEPALREISAAPLGISDQAAPTVLEMAAECRRQARERGLGLVVVDYLQLMGTRGRAETRNDEVALLTRGLKALAKELRVPVLVLSQLTRSPEKDAREPRLSDLRDSGAIEQDADMVIFLHRPKQFAREASFEERAQTKLIVAKQRNGPTDALDYVFFQDWMRFEEAAQKGRS